MDLAKLFVHRAKSYNNHTMDIINAVQHITEATAEVSEFNIKPSQIEWVSVELLDHEDYQTLNLIGYATVQGKSIRLEGSVPLYLALLNDKQKVVDYYTNIRRLSIFNSAKKQPETRIH